MHRDPGRKYHLKLNFHGYRRRLGEGGAARGYSVCAWSSAGSPTAAELEVGAPAERLPHRAAYYRAFPARLDPSALAPPTRNDARCDPCQATPLSSIP